MRLLQNVPLPESWLAEPKKNILNATQIIKDLFHRIDTDTSLNWVVDSIAYQVSFAVLNSYQF